MIESTADQIEYPLRVNPLMNVAPLLSTLDCQPGPVFRAAGLDPEDFRDPENRIPYVSAARLLELSAQASGCDHFGLRLAQWFVPTHIGISGMLAESAPHVGTALRHLINHFDLHDQGGLVTLDRSMRYVSLGYAIRNPDILAAEQVYDFCVASLYRIMRILCGQNWNASSIQLSRSNPGNPNLYRDYFQAPVHFDATKSAVVFRTKWLDQPLAKPDHLNHANMLDEALRMRESLPMRFSTRVELTLYGRLSHKNTAALVAEMLGIHERTLHRRLESEDSNFRSVLEGARRTTSRYYLQATNLPIGDVARALGYGSTTAFDHAFTRWFGTTPTRWRALLTDCSRSCPGRQYTSTEKSSFQ